MNQSDNSNKPSSPSVRLAFRIEGEFWNCYMAQPHTMEGAHLIGSILAAPVMNNEGFKRKFKTLMESILSDAIIKTTGKRPTKMVTSLAPEHERTKE